MRKLQRRRARDLAGAFVVEGEDLVSAGIEAGANAQVLLIDATRTPELDLEGVKCPKLTVEPSLLASVSSMAHPPRIMGVFDQPADRDAAVYIDYRARSGNTGPWLMLDGLGDPGNVGTILRTAVSLSAGGVITLPDTSDPFSPKAVRASMGACFHLPIIRLDSLSIDAVDELMAIRAAVPALQVIALDGRSDTPIWEANFDATTIITVGAEREGVSGPILAYADMVVSIPQDPHMQSMNAGVAASIALYEWCRSQGKGRQ